MKAAYYKKHGGPEVLEVGDLDLSTPGAGEVRVRLRAAALNHLDLFVRGGLPNLKLPFPHVPGADGAGEVDLLGPDVTGFSAGDRVLIQPGLFCAACEFCRAGEHSLCIRYRILGEHASGTLAETVVVPARNLYPIPGGLDWASAAAFPLAYETAWRLVMGRGALRAGEQVLIHGIGGGVAVASLQIAKLAGARAIVTSSSNEKLAMAKELGAETGLNYRETDVEKEVRTLTGKRGVDLVVDSVGEATWMTSLKSVAKGGRIVTCGATTGPNPAEEMRLIFWKQISILGSTMANLREFDELYRVVSSGAIRPVIDRVYPLEKAGDAFARLESARHMGKIVVTIGE